MKPAVAVLTLALAAAVLAAYAGAAAADSLEAPVGLAPDEGADVRDAQPELTWQAVPGAAGYRLGWSAGDGAARESAEVPGNATRWAFPKPLPENTHVVWSVAAVGADGVTGPSSAAADFWVGRDNVAPEPAGDFVARAWDGGAELTWVASPSADAAGYLLYIRTEGGTYANPRALGAVTSTRVEALENGVGYEFMLTAVDAAGNESVGVVAAVEPGALVTLRGRSYARIQDAVDAAQAGETVDLGAGVFLEGVLLKPGVSLRGAGPGLTLLDASGFPAAITLESSDASDAARSTVSHLAIRGGAAGIWGGVARLRLENVVIARVNGPGVRLDGGALEAARVTIVRCLRDGIETGAAGTLVDALILRNGGAGVLVRAPGDLRVSWSDLHDNLLGGLVGTEAGEGVTATAVQFENEDADDYRVRAGDPSVDAGDPASPWELEPLPNGGRVNLGAYGNTPWATASLAPAAGTKVNDGRGSERSRSRSNSYCIVATASFGSAGQGTVASLREFRDRVLRPMPSGEAVVGAYERAAAPVARVVGRSEVMRAVFRAALGR